MIHGKENSPMSHDDTLWNPGSAMHEPWKSEVQSILEPTLPVLSQPKQNLNGGQTAEFGVVPWMSHGRVKYSQFLSQP